MYIEPHAPQIYCPWCRRSYHVTRNLGTVRNRMARNDAINTKGLHVAFCDEHRDAAERALYGRAQVDGDLERIEEWFRRLYNGQGVTRPRIKRPRW